MANKQLVKIDYAILCDDIRQENNGKLIIIGMYSGDILVSNLPGSILVATLLHGHADADSSITIEVRFRAEFDDADPFTVAAEGNLEIRGTDRSKEFFTPLPKMMIEARGKGEISFDYRLDKKRWKTLLRKRINRRDT